MLITSDDMNALRTGFETPEMEISNVNHGVASTYPSTKIYDSAYDNGIKLKMLVLFVFSADSMTDYRADIAAYDEFVEVLNRKYGRIALSSEEAQATEPTAFGLIGHRTSPWTSITTTDQNGNVSVQYPQSEVEAQDAQQDDASKR